ncbi:MAG TPA: 4Fe-4S ferredoxin [Desulfobacteraceae bacterium]|nr:4Fe-4S binding protein [Deltaproteobacteria bacterium]RLB97151.1 MAG: 4Fe-4S ferredoxin [Deltaproteobacteria bacterium]HDI59119.1 4Fe-4S ferredoxin [Desulfobacteraceae bacterium]
MKVKRKIIEIDEEKCDGCGLCVPACAEGSLQVVDGKARVISETLCDGLGACLGECPQGALRIVERVAEEFDEEAVEKHLAATGPTLSAPSSCPSAGIRLFAPADACGEANRPAKLDASASALSHWPVQIRLVPPHAPFLKNADLLVLADCAAVATADLHEGYLRGRVVLMGCPKFDDADDYVSRFTEIFATAGIRSITILYMEVPCCGGLPRIIEKALKASGRDIPVETVCLACNGDRLAPAA